MKDKKDKETGNVTKELSHDKFANTPIRCFFRNGNIQGEKCPEDLDKQWYIDLANERLKQFGVK